MSRERSSPATEIEAVEHSKGLTFWGFAASVIYVGAMLSYALMTWPQLRAMEPNEFGDLLAGVFSPLAFLWLVLGFFQQGHELRASVRALELQGQELQNSVEQQRQLVAVTREELKFQSEMLARQESEQDRTSQPILELTCYGNAGSDVPGHRGYFFRIVNFGPKATNIRIIDDRGEAVFRQGAIDTAGNITFKMDLPTDVSETRTLTVHYMDARGLERSRSFAVILELGRLSTRPD